MVINHPSTSQDQRATAETRLALVRLQPWFQSPSQEITLL